MKIILTIIFSAISFASFSQLETDFYGTWEVEKLEIATDFGNQIEDKNEKMKVLETAFSSSVFQFSDNNLMNYKMELLEIDFQNSFWIFDNEKKRIEIFETKKQEKSLMEIYVQKLEKGKLLFILAETPIALTVVKK